LFNCFQGDALWLAGLPETAMEASCVLLPAASSDCVRQKQQKVIEMKVLRLINVFRQVGMVCGILHQINRNYNENHGLY